MLQSRDQWSRSVVFSNENAAARIAAQRRTLIEVDATLPSLALRASAVALLLHFKFPFNHVIIRLLRRTFRFATGRGGFGPAGRSTGATLLVQHFAERVRGGFELLDGRLDR